MIWLDLRKSNKTSIRKYLNPLKDWVAFGNHEKE